MADLTPEERKKIYLEEKAKDEALKQKNIGCLGFIRSCFGYLFLLASFGSLTTSNWVGFIAYFLIAILMIRRFSNFFESKFNFKMQGWQRLVAIILLLMITGSTSSNPPSLPETNNSTGTDTKPTSVSAEASKPIIQSKWEYPTSVDDLSGKTIYNAAIKSENFHSFDFPYQGDTYGTLFLRKHPRYGKDIIFQLDRGQILCHSYGDCSVTIRFDKKNPITITANPSGDNASEVIFLPYKRLFNLIKNSKKMVIEVSVYQEGAPSFTFNTENLNWKS
jgi:hypothetical protein